MRSVWPSKIARRVNLETDSHAVALEACLGGTHLTAMERLIARPLVKEKRLSEINTTLLGPAALVVCRHAEKGRSPVVVAACKAVSTVVKRLVRQDA
jgi:hypothetical protein